MAYAGGPKMARKNYYGMVAKERQFHTKSAEAARRKRRSPGKGIPSPYHKNVYARLR